MTELLQGVINAASLGSIYALLALGIALIYGIMRLLNFAHGDLVTVAAYTMFLVGAISWPLLMAIALVVTILIALVIERLAFRPVRAGDEATLLITSFALSYVLQNLGVLAFTSRPRGLFIPPPWLGSTVDFGVASVPAIDLVTTIVTAVLMVALAAFLKRNPIGLRMRAAAEDFQMCRALGISANRIVATAFAISGGLAAVASILFVARTGTITPNMGLTPVVIAFVATILGGMGSLGGAVLGAYLMGALTVVLQTGLPLGARPYRDAILFLAVFLVLVFRPQGLIVTKAARSRV